MELLSLPLEVLEGIMALLMPEDIISLSKTCKVFSRLAQSEQVWSTACLKTSGVKISPAGGCAKKFYKEVIHKYGKFVGLWKIHADCYGGLLQIKYAEGKLCGQELQPPKNPYIMHPLRRKTVFSVDITENEDIPNIMCCINPLHKHPCILNYEKKALTPGSPLSYYLTRQCANSSDHQENPDLTIDLENWLADQSEFIGEEAAYTRRQMIYKYMVLRQIDLKTHYSRLTLPLRSDFHVPIQPGLFKGTYASHGLELVMLEYEDMNKIKAVKITGDPNVPSGQITFRADLPFCMHLNEEEQSSFESIELIHPASSEVDWSELSSEQPFVVPLECNERYNQVPNRCKARFHGFGQIAAEGFQNSSFVEGHWVVFSEDLFGFLWISLQAFSMYHRVQENLS